MDGSEPIWPPDEIIGAGAAVSAGPESRTPVEPPAEAVPPAVLPPRPRPPAPPQASTPPTPAAPLPKRIPPPVTLHGSGSPWATAPGSVGTDPWNSGSWHTIDEPPDQPPDSVPPHDAHQEPVRSGPGQSGPNRVASRYSGSEAPPTHDDPDADPRQWTGTAGADGWGREGVPAARLPWAQPPRAAPHVAPDVPRTPESRSPESRSPESWLPDLRRPELTRPDEHMAIRSAPEPKALPRIAVISGDARIGSLVARLLAEMLDHEHRGGGLVRDAGAEIEAPAWQPAVDWADQVILAVDAAGIGPAKAARLLDRTGLRDAMAVVMLPPPRRGLSRGHEDIGAIRAHFEGRTKSVLFVPNDAQPTVASHAAWRRIVAGLSDAVT